MATADHGATDDSSGGRLLVWDCGSVLYDSYELSAFKRQLDAAVLASSRSLSMPHLTASSVATTSPPTPTPTAADAQHQQQARRRGRRRRLPVPALLRRLFSKVLRLRLFPATGARGARYRTGDDGTGSPWSGALTSIPEEQSSSSPDPETMAEESPVEPAQSKLRKTQSERFIGSKTASSMVQFEVVL